MGANTARKDTLMKLKSASMAQDHENGLYLESSSISIASGPPSPCDNDHYYASVICLGDDLTILISGYFGLHICHAHDGDRLFSIIDAPSKRPKASLHNFSSLKARWQPFRRRNDGLIHSELSPILVRASQYPRHCQS